MENKINIARFKEGSRTAEVKDIWQWDYGQILRIQGLNLPTAVEIHFSLDEHGGEAVRRIGVTKDGVTDVPIPDSMVENESAYGDSYYFFAYIYLTDETSGNTEYKIRAKVSTRSRPEGYVSGGNDTFAEILKTVNEIAEEKVDVPVPAKVGQVLAVKSVDEEGKPTEFEAHPIEETDPTVPEWAKQPEKPTYTASEVGADAAGTAESKVSAHNVSDTAHNDIRLLVQGLAERLNTLADSDDETLDQMSEVVAYIKSNKNLIDAITTSKINVSDIIDNLTANVSNKPLSAAQGVKLKALIDAIAVVELDESLTDNTKAAPAGMVGELKGDLNDVKDTVIIKKEVEVQTVCDITKNDGHYFSVNGDNFVSFEPSDDTNSAYLTVSEGETYIFNCTAIKNEWSAYGGYGYCYAHIGDASVNYHMVADYIWYEKTGDAEHRVTIPEGVNRLVINRKVANGEIVVKKITTKTVNESKSYSKEETYSKEECDNIFIKNKERKTVVIFNYDMTALDGRYDLMVKNGWSATWQVIPDTDVEMIKTLVKNGQDLSLYSGYDNSKTIEEIRNDIQAKINEIENKGVFRTCLFSCGGHQTGYKLEQALSTLPFRYIRASVYQNEDGSIDYPTTLTYPNEKRQDVRALSNYKDMTFEQIKENLIDKWVNEKRPMLMLMLHTYEFDNFNEDKFKQIVSYVKQLENEGKVLVMSAREYYEYYYPEEGKKDDRIRLESSIINLY